LTPHTEIKNKEIQGWRKACPGEITGVGVPNLQEEINRQMDEQCGPRAPELNLRDWKHRDYSWRYGFDCIDDTRLATFEEPMGELFIMEQMSLKKGLERFGKDGVNAVIAEMKQLHYQNLIMPIKAPDLTREEKRKSLMYHMYLKQKRCSQIKAHGCADG
jgi:hypothetical protein